MLLSGTIKSGSVSYFSSVASFHVNADLFKPAEYVNPVTLQSLGFIPSCFERNDGIICGQPGLR